MTMNSKQKEGMTKGRIIGTEFANCIPTELKAVGEILMTKELGHDFVVGAVCKFRSFIISIAIRKNGDIFSL